MHRPPLIRHLTRSVVFATAVTAVVVANGTHSQPVGAADGLPAGTLAQYVGFDERARFQNAESALGRRLDRVVTMADHKSPSAMRASVWGQFTKSTAYLPSVSDRVDVTVTIPLAFGQNGLYQTVGPQAVAKNLQQTLSGAYDADYRTVAKSLISAGFSDAVLRLGHEFDGTWYPWSARDNEQKYIEAFRHVRDVFKQESSAFRFEWTGMRAPWIAHARKAYPGDAYVDIIGLDIYHRSTAEISDTLWNSQYKAPLTAHRDFAISRGKPVSFPEWGRAFGDTDRFITLMHDWFSDLPTSGPGRLEYQSYFNPPGQGGNYDLDNHPAVKRRYVQLFSTTATRTAVSPTTPSTTAPLSASTLESATRLSQSTSQSLTTTNALPSSASSITLRPLAGALELSWFHEGAENRNIRHRIAGSTTWTWVRNGAWKQVISGLRSGTAYEVQARAFSNGAWQPWMTATATTK
jgi:hypothetical protein